MTRFATALSTSVIFVAVLTGCDALSQGVQSSTHVLARAAGHELTIEEAADLLANQRQLPNQPEVVEALANLWIDYTLLSVAMHGDTSLQSYDLIPVVRDEVEQLKVYKLRDSVIRPDTAITDEELRRLFQEELPGARLRARHILLHYPDQATDEERDSVAQLAASLKERAQAGEDFAALAREYSDDRGSAPRGGDLGWFSRGEMVRPFEEAALAAEPGEIVGPVESPYGTHILRVEERDVPDWDEHKSRFRTQVVRRRVADAESMYVAALEDSAHVTIPDEASEIVRELARRPQVRLSSRAADRAVTRYRGGELSAGEFQEYVQARPPGFRNQLAQGEEAQIEGLLRGLTLAELLVNAADEEGLDATEAERDSLLIQARNQVVQAARTLRLWPLEAQEEDSLAAAIDRGVLDTLRRTLAGEEDVLRLGRIAYALRQNFRGEILAHNITRVNERVQSVQGSSRPPPGPRGAPPGPGPSGPQRAPNAPPDTTGG